MRTFRNLAIGLAVLSLLLFFAMTSSERAYKAKAAAPDNMSVVKQALKPLSQRKNAQDPTTITLSNRELAAGSALLANAMQPASISSQLNENEWGAGVSYPLPLGRWLNVKASLPAENYQASEDSLPPIDLKIGAVALPRFASRYVVDLAIRRAKKKYPDLPEPHEVVRSVEFSQSSVDVTIVLPRSRDIYSKASALSGNKFDEKLVKKALCHLTHQYKSAPNDDFAVHVRRAFSTAAVGEGGSMEDRNRSSLVALSLFVGGPPAYRLFYTDGTRDSDCPIPNTSAIQLHNRADLAKHWAVSSALAATIGVNFTGAMGEWKELSDSLPKGSGFSFVDLAADQSGYRYGNAAINKDSAADMNKRLRIITPDALIPTSLLAVKEGLSTQEFEANYSNLDSKQYKAMYKVIEQELTKAGVPE